MNASPVLDMRPTLAVEPDHADEELGLAELLALFASEESPAVATPAGRSLSFSAARLRAWSREWRRRATAWGAGPGGAWRAW
jgi:hypothetical protein